MLNNTYRVLGRVNCILDPLGDKESVFLTVKINSVIKQPSNKVGRAIIDLHIYNEDINHFKQGWKIDIEDPDEKVKELEGWVPQVLSKLEFRITEHINDDNAIKMIEELMAFRHDVREAIMNEPIKTS